MKYFRDNNADYKSHFQGTSKVVERKRFKERKMIRLSISMPKEMHDKVKIIAEKNDESCVSIVRDALREYIVDLSQYDYDKLERQIKRVNRYR